MLGPSPFPVLTTWSVVGTLKSMDKYSRKECSMTCLRPIREGYRIIFNSLRVVYIEHILCMLSYTVACFCDSGTVHGNMLSESAHNNHSPWEA